MIAIWMLAVVLFVAIPTLALLTCSVTLDDGRIALDNYTEVLSRADVWEAVANSFLIAFGSTALALVIGVPFAYLVSRTDMPGRGFFRSVCVLTFAAPGFIAAMGWILLLGPRNGLINQYVVVPLGLQPIDIFSPGGIIFVLGFFLYPQILLPVADAFDNFDSRLEEAGESLGATRLHVLSRVTLPLIVPSMFSGAVLVFITSFLIFGPVALLGGPIGFRTIPTAIFALMSYPPHIEYAAVLAVPVVALLIGLVWLQRVIYGRRKFTTVAGKPGLRRAVKLGAWGPVWSVVGMVVFIISVVLPFGVLVLTSFRRSIARPVGPDNFAFFDNYAALFQRDDIVRSFGTSVVLALSATLIALGVAIIAGWISDRSGWRGKGMVQPMMLLPLALPGAILGIALIIAYSGAPLWLGGTFGILLVAYVIRVIPQSFQYVHAGFKQVGAEMDEAARSLGATLPQTLRSVTVPLIRGPLLSVGILSFVVLFRELDTSVFLYTGANPVAPVVLFSLASQSQFQLMGALAVVMLLFNLLVVLVARKALGVKVGG